MSEPISRDDVFARVWRLVPVGAGPVLVAVDGPDGAGKTTFADGLADSAPRSTVVRASLDDFHHLQAQRHAEGRSGDTVWERSFDYEAVRRELLDPWRRGPGSPYRRRWHDLATDAYVHETLSAVPEQGILVVDGVFAQRPELDGIWDFVVYVDAPEAVRLSRMAARDGVPDDAAHPDQRRYLDAQRIYVGRFHPCDRVDVVVENEVPERPLIVRPSMAP